ncbi:MAG TPA: hypothetical protein VF062_04765 [Candidatus Limnocylindrales bacterium]
MRFSVKWGKGARTMQFIFFAFFALVTLGWAVMSFHPSTWDPAPEGIWLVRSFLPLFLACALIMLSLYRFGVRLDGGRLVQQGALWPKRIDLRTASFAMTVMKWQYTRAFSGGFARVAISTPALVVRASRWRRIKLPLAQRAPQQAADGRYHAAWLPAQEILALADAIDRYATAAGKEQVVAFLRDLDRSPVKPSLDFYAPF